MKKNKKPNKEKNKIGDSMGLSPQLTVLSNREAQLDGCREIREYDDGKIKLSMGKFNVCFCGNNLVIKNYGDDYAIISGEFSDISFD